MSDFVRAWSTLWARSTDATVFQHPAWLLSWWRHLGHAYEPWVVAVYNRGSLAGVAPLSLLRGEDGLRRLVWMGGDVSDYHGLLAVPDKRDAVVREVLRQLDARSDGWDEAALDKLESSSPMLSAALPDARIRRSEQDVCPFLPLQRVPPLPSGFRGRLRQALRRVRRAGRYEVAMAHPGDLSQRLDVLFRLHRARWRQRAQEGLLASPEVQAMHRDAARLLIRQGLLRLLELRLDGTPIAAIEAFAGHGRFLVYTSGFDPAFAVLSPGRLAIAELLALAMHEGARELDFLRGTEPYKYDWGAQNRSTWSLRLAHGATP